MTKYQAMVMHGKRGGEGCYTFDGPDDLMTKSPVGVMRVFMDSVEAHDGIGHIDYEINAALKNKEHEIVTVIGDLIFERHGVQPFMCMIARADLH